MATFAVILPAAGKSSRFGDPNYKKPYAPLDNRAVWLHAADKFLSRDDVKQVLIIVAPEDYDDFCSKYAANVTILGIQVVKGGAERSDSVTNALAHVRAEIDFVAIHDAARPCLVPEWIDQVFAAAERFDAALLAIPISGTIKRMGKDQCVDQTVPRERLWEAQTPQVFRRQLLIDAYARRGKEPATDDAQLVERLGKRVRIVPGSPLNVKITSKEDLRLAAQILKALPKPKTLGPVHPFAEDDLWR